MKYAINVRNKKLKEQFEEGIHKIFPNIECSSPEEIIERNSPGVIVIDELEFQDLIKTRNFKVNLENRNYLLVVVTQGKLKTFEYVDLVTDTLDKRVIESLQKKLQEKMRQLTIKKIKEIPERLLKIYEELGCGLIIVDRKLKIVFANKKALNLFKERFSENELLNMNFERILELFTDSFTRNSIKKAIKNAVELNVDVELKLSDRLTKNLHLSILPRRTSDGSNYGAFISLEELTNGEVSRKLWERTNSLIERLEKIIPEIGENFFESIGEILKNFASINKLKTLLFIPVIFRKLEEYSEDTPIIFVYKNKHGKYGYRVTYDQEIYDEIISLFNAHSYKVSKFFEIYKRPEDIEDFKEAPISLNHQLICNGKAIGLLLMDKDTPPLREEKFFIKWFEKELALLMIKAIVESPSKLVNFIESLIGTSQKIAIVIVNNEGTILRANKKFYDLFNVPDNFQLEGLHISDMPWLRTHHEIVEKISEHIGKRKPFNKKRWISVSESDERFLEISGFPIKTELILTNRNYYVWTFEDLTEKKLGEIRRDFVQTVLKRKMQIYEEISSLLRGGRYDKYPEFLIRAPEIVCKNLSLISEGSVFFIKNFSIQERQSKPCTVCGSVKDAISDNDICYLVSEVERIRLNKGIFNEPSIISAKNLKLNKVLEARGFDKILVIPISLQEIIPPIGYILLFSKKRSVFWRILNRLPEMMPLSSAQFEEVDLFIQFAEKVSTYLQIVRKEAEMIEREKFAEEIYDHVEDIVLIESFDGIIEFANRKAENFYGYSRNELIGKSVDILIPANMLNLKDKIRKELKEKGEYSIIAPNKDFQGQIKWLNFDFRVVKFGGVDKVLVVAHDITELREHLRTLNDMLVGTISALFNILENRSSALKKHSINVAFLSGEIARKLRNQKEFTTERKIMCLTMAGLLHDIGKITIPTSILAQPKEELIKKPHNYRLYMSHPQTGANIVKGIPLPCREAISKWIEQHHEKLDGTGFPMGKKIKPEEITLGARIIAVANEFENEVISKPMHKARPPEEVLDRFMSSNEFDKTVVKALIELYNEGIVDKLVEKDEEADKKIKEIFDFLTGIYGERQNVEKYR